MVHQKLSQGIYNEYPARCLYCSNQAYRRNFVVNERAYENHHTHTHNERTHSFLLFLNCVLLLLLLVVIEGSILASMLIEYCLQYFSIKLDRKQKKLSDKKNKYYIVIYLTISDFRLHIARRTHFMESPLIWTFWTVNESQMIKTCVSSGFKRKELNGNRNWTSQRSIVIQDTFKYMRANGARAHLKRFYLVAFIHSAKKFKWWRKRGRGDKAITMMRIVKTKKTTAI